MIFSDTQIYQGVGCLGPSAPACVSPVPVFLSYRPRKPSRCGFRWPRRNHGGGGGQVELAGGFLSCIAATGFLRGPGTTAYFIFPLLSFWSGAAWERGTVFPISSPFCQVSSGPHGFPEALQILHHEKEVSQLLRLSLSGAEWNRFTRCTLIPHVPL